MSSPQDMLSYLVVIGIFALALWWPARWSRRHPEALWVPWAAGLLRTWAVAEVLALGWLPPPGPPPWHILEERVLENGMWVPGQIGLPPEPEDDRLVLVMGDSFAQGQGADRAHSMPAHLRRALAADGVRVRNHGYRGSEFADQLTRYALMDRELSPDVLLWSYTLNDLEFEYPWRDAISVWGELTVRGPTPLLAAIRRVGAAWWTRDDMEAGYLALYDPEGAPYREFEDGLRRVIAATRARGARFVFVVWPLLHRLDDYPVRDVHRQLLATARDAGAEGVDLLDVFEGRDERALWAHPTDHHPNAEGYAMASEAVIAALRAAPIPDSEPWGPGATTLLAPPRDALERAWAASPTVATLRDNARRLFELHRDAIRRGERHPMIGRVPPLMLTSAWLRQPPDSAEAKEDLATLRTWGFAQP